MFKEQQAMFLQWYANAGPMLEIDPCFSTDQDTSFKLGATSTIANHENNEYARYKIWIRRYKMLKMEKISTTNVIYMQPTKNQDKIEFKVQWRGTSTLVRKFQLHP